jgi:hypothetical protein
MEKIYVMTPSDGIQTCLASIIRGLDNVKLLYVQPGLTFTAVLKDKDVIAIFVARDEEDEGRFPSRHIRRRDSVETAEKRGFKLPQALLDAVVSTPARVVAVRPSALSDPQKLRLALENEHCRTPDHAWIPDTKKRRSPSRQARSKRWRENQQYAL